MQLIRIVSLVLLAGMAAPEPQPSASCDIRVPPYSFVVSSWPSGRWYARMATPSNGSLKRTKCSVYEVDIDGKDLLRWETEGWYERDVFLADDGEVLIAVARELPGDEPADDDVAVSFRNRDGVFRTHSTKDLVKDSSGVDLRQASYLYLGPGRLGFHDAHVGVRFHLTTIDGIEYEFDFETGAITGERRVQVARNESPPAGGRLAGVTLSRVEWLDDRRQGFSRVEVKLSNGSDHDVHFAAGDDLLRSPDPWVRIQLLRDGEWKGPGLTYQDDGTSGYLTRQGRSTWCRLRPGSTVYFEAGVIHRDMFKEAAKARIALLVSTTTSDEQAVLIATDPFDWVD